MTPEQINEYLSAQQQMGVYTKETAKFAKSELAKLQYRSDLKYSDLNTCIRNANIQLTNSRNLENGSGLVWVDFHLGARPSHAEWHGKVYSLDGAKTVNGVEYGDFYEECRVGEPVTGFGGINCRHYTIPWSADWGKDDGKTPNKPSLPLPTEPDQPTYPPYNPPTPPSRAKKLISSSNNDWWWDWWWRWYQNQRATERKNEREYERWLNDYIKGCQAIQTPARLEKTWTFGHLQTPVVASQSFRGLKMSTGEAGRIKCSAFCYALRLKGYMVKDKDFTKSPKIDDVFFYTPSTRYFGRYYLTSDNYIFYNGEYYDPLSQSVVELAETNDREFYSIDSLTPNQQTIDNWFDVLLYKSTYSENRKSR